MATIEQRGDFQYRVRLRRHGITLTRTFEKLRDAQAWARIEEGRITGEEYVDRRLSKMTPLAKALDFYEAEGIGKSRPDTKNKLSKLKYWREGRFASWSLLSIRSCNLLAWRRDALDEDNADDEEAFGPERECSPQTVVHRLNVLSQVYKFCVLHRDNTVINAVVEGVRPSLNKACWSRRTAASWRQPSRLLRVGLR